MVVIAFLVVVCVAGCAQSQTTPLKAARLTIDGATHTTRPPACSQMQSYRTIDIRDHDRRVEAVVLLSADRAIPQWVKIRDIDGFTGSFWEGGVGSAHGGYTIPGSGD